MHLGCAEEEAARQASSRAADSEGLLLSPGFSPSARKVANSHAEFSSSRRPQLGADRDVSQWQWCAGSERTASSWLAREVHGPDEQLHAGPAFPPIELSAAARSEPCAISRIGADIAFNDR